jgi:hypothetical protein
MLDAAGLIWPRLCNPLPVRRQERSVCMTSCKRHSRRPLLPPPHGTAAASPAPPNKRSFAQTFAREGQRVFLLGIGADRYGNLCSGRHGGRVAAAALVSTPHSNNATIYTANKHAVTHRTHLIVMMVLDDIAHVQQLGGWNTTL